LYERLSDMVVEKTKNVYPEMLGMRY